MGLLATGGVGQPLHQLSLLASPHPAPLSPQQACTGPEVYLEEPQGKPGCQEGSEQGPLCTLLTSFPS